MLAGMLRPTLLAVTALIGATVVADVAQAQHTPRHFRHGADLAPGRIGRDQLTRGGDFIGYFQPVVVQAPQGAEVSLLDEGGFVPSGGSQATAGMLIGEVYRARITRIPDFPGFEIYPTIEVINRLYPPAGSETRFPIPVQITEEDIAQALDGKFVTRVIYLEDPQTALPVAEVGGEQRVFNVGPREDPLLTADRLGRPMAILRLGSRVPLGMDDWQQIYGTPPLYRWED